MITANDASRFLRAAPFWTSLSLLPALAAGALIGGPAVFALIVFTFGVFTLLDMVLGLNAQTVDPETSHDKLFWYRLITLIWPALQVIAVFGCIAYVTMTDNLSGLEVIGLMIGLGAVTGPVGIVYAHELMHQHSKTERWLGDVLMAMVLYGHFRSEHLLVHHRYVGTPRDTVTARFGEGFHSFFVRVLPGTLLSAWRAERTMLSRKDLHWWHRSNPFWRYAALQGAFLLAAYLIGGWTGVGLFALQAFVAIWYVELINYIEHYGLTRKHLGEGKYEHTQPRHSWNTTYAATNWLLINLQRHSDHHFKPDRSYPLLQNYDETEAPQLPFGYTLMFAIALVPPLWRQMMDPRVERWRAMYYPEITDWSAYDAAATPLPR